LPVFFATGDRKRAIFLSFVSGLAEPLGVIVVLLFLDGYITQKLTSQLLAAVAGVMTFLSLSQLLPLAVKAVGEREAFRCALAGAILMVLLIQIMAALEK
jgi:ZIP family zinc transporter